MLKITKSFKKLAPKVLETNNNKIIGDSNSAKTDGTDKISVKSKNIKNFVKPKNPQKPNV